MAATGNDIDVVSMIKNLKADLDSKSNDIAEIKESVNVLKSLLLATNRITASMKKQLDDEDEKEFISYHSQSPEEHGSDNLSSVGTSLTKVSRSGSQQASSQYDETDKKGIMDPLGASISPGDEDSRPKATECPAWLNPNSASQVGHVIPSPVAPVFPPMNDISINDANGQAKNSQRILPLNQIAAASGNQNSMTKIMINGVPRNIPSGKGSAPKKSFYAQNKEALGPSQPVPFTRTVRNSAPAKFAGMQSGMPLRNFTAPPISTKQYQPFEKSNQRRVSEPHRSRKPRPAKYCTSCGDQAHHLYDCPKAGIIHLEGSDGRQFKPEHADASEKAGPAQRTFGNGKGPIFRPSEKAPGYPVDRQLELINTVIVRLEADGWRPPPRQYFDANGNLIAMVDVVNANYSDD
ncbi:hypothetical protein TWF694_001193 [Orbilia ellipsospora]|uniref:CCHC-type domain-containing protein n=1 Tax=Orbilia ellipsospora TaxID=2528407 RepID=A0AAV9XTH5_9PEZI